MEYNFDIIIVGAGIAGCFLAKKTSEGGFKVCLIEIKKIAEIGYPWEVLVDEKVFNQVGLRLPSTEVRPEHPFLYRFFCKTQKNYIEMSSEDDSIYFLRHKRLNQKLLSMAIDAGVNFFDNHKVTELILNNNYTCGVRGYRKTPFANKSFLFKSKIIVDASGTERILCRQTPEDFMIQSKINKNDWVSVWQEVHQINPKQYDNLRASLNIEPGICNIRVGKHHAYQIIHMRQDNTVKILFSGSIGEHTPPAHRQCRDFIDTNPFFRHRLYGGGKFITIRRSIDSMVGNGFLCIGDTACQIVPPIGRGVSSALYAADIAARTVSKAININNFSINALWEYNYNYQSKRGAILASYDIFRLFFQKLTEDEVNTIFESHLLKKENFITLFSTNKAIYNLQQIIEKLSTIISKASLIPIGMHLVQAIVDSKKILNIYKNYPKEYNKRKFLNWIKQTNSIFLKHNNVK